MMDMPRLTAAYAAILIALGLIAYLINMASWTALIPSIIGVLFLALASLAILIPGSRKHVMHVAALLALLILFGVFRSVPKALGLLTGAEVERPIAVVVQAITFFLTAGYLGLSINSFIQARRKRIS